jgi:hypothetical protein
MSDHDLWQVKLSEGCVVEMTLDEIDTAFNAGRIAARTSVLPPGDLRWTTLGEAAGLEDAGLAEDDRPAEPAPYSLAPVAYEAHANPQPLLYDFGDGIDVDLESNAGLPRRRGIFGKVVGVAVLFAVLIGAGITGGAYAARPTEFKAKIAEAKTRIMHGSSAPKAAAAAQPPPPVQESPPAPPPPAQSSREIPPPPPAAETAAPAPAPAPIPTKHASTSGTSVANLPNAKGTKAAPAKERR